MSIPYAEIQNLAASAVLELFVLDATPCGGGTYYFHAGTNQLNGSVVWQGQTYAPMPIQADGFEWSSKGTLPRPKLRVAALDGVVGGLVRDLEDLVGARVTRKMCFAKHLDVVNFPAAYNPTADPTAHWPDEPWVVERKTLEDNEILEFELVSPMDVQNAQIPKRRITANACPWLFKGAECGYTGPDATCTKTLTDCKAKHALSTGTISLAATSTPNTYVRTTGNFLVNGFVAGQVVFASGFTLAENNGTSRIISVSALVMEVDRDTLTDAAAGGRTITLFPALPFGGFPGTARVR